MRGAERATACEPDVILFGQSFVHSDAFKALFREGMGLVEEAAAYLDGPGREESRRLSRRVSLAYAGESMRLTTRLMQIASWLLVQRAVSEGELTAAQAAKEKGRTRLRAQEAPTPSQDFDALPAPLRDLVALSVRLHVRVMHLDRLMTLEAVAPAPRRSPVAIQHSFITSAFAERT
jgi:regulator of CtrA degradation